MVSSLGREERKSRPEKSSPDPEAREDDKDDGELEREAKAAAHAAAQQHKAGNYTHKNDNRQHAAQRLDAVCRAVSVERDNDSEAYRERRE